MIDSVQNIEEDLGRAARLLDNPIFDSSFLGAFPNGQSLANELQDGCIHLPINTRFEGDLLRDE